MQPAPVIPVEELIRAARRPEVREAVERLYADAEAEIAAHAPTCWNKGECCQFGQYGHRLYVTALEVACYLAQGGLTEAGPQPALDARADACPHAREGRCQARDRRPLGCRIFYCDPAAQHWQGPLTERCLQRLRSLHDELGVPYFYADWMSVLAALGGSPK
jgi:hypothetical protein